MITTVSLTINYSGTYKLMFIKHVKDLLGLGLKDAKQVIDGDKPLNLKLGTGSNTVEWFLGELIHFANKSEQPNSVKVEITPFLYDL